MSRNRINFSVIKRRDPRYVLSQSALALVVYLIVAGLLVLSWQWWGLSVIFQNIARYQTGSVTLLILANLFLLILVIRVKRWRLTLVLITFLLTTSFTMAFVATDWPQQIQDYRQQYVLDSKDESQARSSSKLDSAKSALDKLLHRTRTATESSAIQSESEQCDEQQSLQAAKACTFLISTNLGHGSGFAISSDYLLTNKHVIDRASQISTIVADQQVSLQLWNFLEDADLALLKSPQPLTSCQLADSSHIPLAETLYTVGWPNSAEGESSITKGIFSRYVITTEGPTFIQTDAAINPGNSGGPLVSPCGIVGINTAKIAWSSSDVPSEGFGFAIKGNYAQDKITELIETGHNYQLPVTDLGQTEYSFAQPSQPQQAPNPGYTLTPEARQSWLQSQAVTQELGAYWSEHGATVDQNKLEELKDLIARMQAVVDTVLPKIKNNQALTQAESTLLADWNDMYGKAIQLEGDLHDRDYTQGYAHYSCQNQSCLLVAGRGQDDCQSQQECLTPYHYQCQDMMCALVEGEGENDCNSHDDCYHYQCRSDGCSKVAGEGSDECYYDWQCAN